MKSRIIIALFLFIFCYHTEASIAQSTVSYGYDPAGNRISRIIVFDSLRADHQEEEEEITIHAEKLNAVELRIYPNPTDGLLKIDLLNLDEEQKATVWLYNLSGNLIVKKDKISTSTELNISNQPAGIYILRIIAGELQTEWKIIKK